jgi:hypothetical protein
VEAIDAGAGIERVVVERGGDVLAVLTELPFQLDWPGGCGDTPVRVVATDRAGNQSEEETTVSADDFQDLDCDGSIAPMFGGPDCDDSSASFHPDAEDTVTSLLDFNCDGVPGVDADHDGVPSLSSGGSDCADSDQGAYEDEGEFVVPLETVASGVEFSWEASPLLLRFADGDTAVAFRRGRALAVAVRRDDGPWVTTEVDPGLDSFLGDASLAGTSVDDLHLVYEAPGALGASALRYATNATGTWAFEPVPEGQVSAETPQIALDAQGRPHVLYETRTEFWLAVRQDGIWTSTALWPNRSRVYRYGFAPRQASDGLVLAATISDAADEHQMYWAEEDAGWFLSPGTTLPGTPTMLSVRGFDEFVVAVSLPDSGQVLGFHGGASQQIGSGLIALSASTPSFRALVYTPDGAALQLGSSHPVDASACSGVAITGIR